MAPRCALDLQRQINVYDKQMVESQVPFQCGENRPESARDDALVDAGSLQHSRHDGTGESLSSGRGKSPRGEAVFFLLCHE